MVIIDARKSEPPDDGTRSPQPGRLATDPAMLPGADTRRRCPAGRMGLRGGTSLSPVRPKNCKPSVIATVQELTAATSKAGSVQPCMRAVLLALAASLRAGLRSRTALQLEVLALRHQLAVYQRLGTRPRIKVADRLLWAGLSRTWSAWRSALVFVRPSTVIAWQRRRFRDHWARLSRPRTGRPAVAQEIRDLIRKMSAANPGWGSPRILGELAKLGISVSKSTVEKYMVRSRNPPSPTWRAFLENHVKDLVSVDFFVVPTEPSPAASTGRCNSTAKDLAWFHPTQGLSRT